MSPRPAAVDPMNEALVELAAKTINRFQDMVGWQTGETRNALIAEIRDAVICAMRNVTNTENQMTELTTIRITIEARVDLDACPLAEIEGGLYIETTANNMSGVIVTTEETYDDVVAGVIVTNKDLYDDDAAAFHAGAGCGLPSGYIVAVEAVEVT